jgi:hypothetical protein
MRDILARRLEFPGYLLRRKKTVVGKMLEVHGS